MSRAEMTRSKAPRTVNMTVSGRRWSVQPNAAYRGSRWECPESGATMNGRLKKKPSASARVTLCKSQFLSALPVSHSNPTQHASSSGNPSTSCILLPYTLAASSTAVSPRDEDRPAVPRAGQCLFECSSCRPIRRAVPRANRSQLLLACASTTSAATIGRALQQLAPRCCHTFSEDLPWYAMVTEQVQTRSFVPSGTPPVRGTRFRTP